MAAPIALVRDGDIVRVDAVAGRLDVLVDPAVWATRTSARADLAGNTVGVGRELFTAFRATVGRADAGAAIFAA